MGNLSKKREVLQQAKFKYDFDRMVYFNRAMKKVFSVEFIEDHTPDELKQRIGEKNGAGWQFYFNSPPAESVRRQLVGVLE